MKQSKRKSIICLSCTVSIKERERVSVSFCAWLHSPFFLGQLKSAFDCYQQTKVWSCWLCALCHTATFPFAYRFILVQFSQLRQFLGEAILATKQHMHSLTIPLPLLAAHVYQMDWLKNLPSEQCAKEQNIARVEMASEWYEVSNETISKWSTDTIVGTENSRHTTWTNNKWHNHWLQSEHCATLSHFMLSSKVNTPWSFILMHILIYRPLWTGHLFLCKVQT